MTPSAGTRKCPFSCASLPPTSSRACAGCVPRPAIGRPCEPRRTSTYPGQTVCSKSEETDCQPRQRTDRTGEERDGERQRPIVGQGEPAIAPCKASPKPENSPDERGVTLEDRASSALERERNNGNEDHGKDGEDGRRLVGTRWAGHRGRRLLFHLVPRRRADRLESRNRNPQQARSHEPSLLRRTKRWF
jgi:hypothetical protein